MYTRFKVSNFKCFDRLEIESLRRINLVVGENNIGKTALLEALFIHCGAYNPTLALIVSAQRGIEAAKVDLSRVKEAPWDTVFTNFDIERVVELEGDDSVTGRRKLKLKGMVTQAELESAEALHLNVNVSLGGVPGLIQHPVSAALTTGVAKIMELQYEYRDRSGKFYLILDPAGPRTYPAIVPPPPFPAFFLAARGRTAPQEEAERFGNLVVEKKQDLIVEALRVIEPRLTRLETVITAGVPVLHGDIGLRRPMPLPLMGGGMSRLAEFMTDLGNARDGVMMVDEIENGLYHAVLPRMWEALDEAAKQFNVQLFATTHSIECVRAAHEAFSKRERYDLQLYRLERSDGEIRAIGYDKETLEAALRTDLEVR